MLKLPHSKINLFLYATLVTISLSIFLIFLSETCAQEIPDRSTSSKEGIYLEQIGIYGGYLFGELKPENTKDDLNMTGVLGNFGYNLNTLLGLETHRGSLQTVLEPFIMAITSPENAVAAGVGFVLRYTYPAFTKTSLFVGLGAGPMYFGAKTFEQGNPGFNFFDHGDAGLHYFFKDTRALTLGYQFFHISDLDINGGPNSGINGHTVFFGISKFF